MEDRRLLSITVDTLIDENDGVGVGNGTSLREAIAAAATGETIDFDSSLTAGGPASIGLTLGELLINKGLTIQGPGADLLTIDASGNDPTPTMKNGDGSRVFNIDDGRSTTHVNVAISGLTLTGGDVNGVGGGLRNRENLTVSSSVITGNRSSGAGGGIYSIHTGTGQRVSVIASTISGNSASHGAGIRSNGQRLDVINSTISGNTANGTGTGGIGASGNLNVISSTVSGNSGGAGGISLLYGQSTIVSSTISGNSASRRGGGIYVVFGDVTVTNSTISGNSAALGGGGIYNNIGNRSDALVVVEYSTIFGNIAPDGRGSGIASFQDASTRTEVRSSIIAGNVNSDVDNVPFVTIDTNTFHSNGYNLIGTGDALTAFNQAGDQVGVSDVMLRPLAYNGGAIQTHDLLVGSPAIDAGDPLAMAGVGNVPEFDQRGTPFTRIHGGRIDIGAIESQPTELMLPDLIVSEIVRTSVSGNQLTVTWTVTNQGMVAANGNWSDRLWLSNDQTVGNDVLIGNLPTLGGSILPAESITREATFTLPSSSLDNHYVVVTTDIFSQLPESNEANNTSIADQPLDLPDLVVSDIVDTSVTGDQLTVTWTVTNQGTAAATGSWTDRIWLSDDDTIGNDAFLGDLAFSGTILAGESATRSTTVTLSASSVNGHYLALTTDFNSQIAELNQANNVSLNDQPLLDARPYDIVVNTLVDENDGVGAGNGTSLREAIAVLAPGWTVRFDPSLTAGGPATIMLTLGELVIDKNLTIQGPGARLLTIDASGNDPTPTVENADGSRVFNIDDGDFFVNSRVFISGLTISGGDVSGAGGGILNEEDLTLSAVTIDGNSAGEGGPFGGGSGGGIYNDGFLSVIASTISNNLASGNGGGIYNSAVLEGACPAGS